MRFIFHKVTQLFSTYVLSSDTIQAAEYLFPCLQNTVHRYQIDSN